MGLVGNLVARLKLDKTHYSSGLKTADTEARGFSSSGSKAFGAFKVAAVAAFAAVSAAVIKSVKDAAEYENTLANISTMVALDVVPTMAIFNDALLEQSKLLGEDTQSLGKGLYDILSAGITDTADALHVLETSAIAAKAGITDTGVAADALTTIINAYGMEAGDAMSVSDLLFTVVQRGKTTFNQLAPAIGRVATIASQAGVDIEEMGAALSIMTRNGISTDESVTALRATIMGFLKPSEELAATFGENAIQTRGFTEVMKELGELPPDMIAKLFPNVRGMLGVITAAKEMTTETQYFIDTLSGGTPTMDAFAKQTDTFNFKWGQFTQTIKAVGIEAGQKVLPGLTDVIEALTEVANDNAETFQNVGTAISEVLRFAGNLIKTLSDLGAEAENTGKKFNFFDSLMKLGGTGFRILGSVIDVMKGVSDELEENATAHLDAADAAKAQRDELNTLLTRYEELRKNVKNLSKEEISEIVNIGRKIKEYKGLVRYTDGYTGTLVLNTKAIADHNKELAKTEYAEILKQMDKTKQGTKEFTELKKRATEIQKQYNVLNRSSEDLEIEAADAAKKAAEEKKKAKEEELKVLEEINKRKLEEEKRLAEKNAEIQEEFRREQLSIREKEIEDIEKQKEIYIAAGVDRVEAERQAQEQIKEIIDQYPTDIEIAYNEAQEKRKEAQEKRKEEIERQIELERKKTDALLELYGTDEERFMESINRKAEEYSRLLEEDFDATKWITDQKEEYIRGKVEESRNLKEKAAKIVAKANEAAAKKTKEAWKKAYDTIKATINIAISSITGTVGAYYDMQEAEIDANVKDQKKAEKEKAKLARDQFNFNKIATVVQIGISTIEAAMKTYAMLGWPFGIAGAAIVGSLGAAQAGMVLATKPPPLPSFNRGGKVEGMAGIDNNIARVSNGEFIVNSSDAQKNMDVLEDINSGGSGVSVTLAPTTINIMTPDERIIGTADLEYIKEQSRLGGIIIHPRAIKAIV